MQPIQKHLVASKENRVLFEASRWVTPKFSSLDKLREALRIATFVGAFSSLCWCSMAVGQTSPPDVGSSDESSIAITYEPVNDRRLSRIYSFSKQIKVLESLRQAANRRTDFSNVQRKLSIKASKCGHINAFYDQRSRTIIMCYEFLNRVLLDLPDEIKRGQEDTSWFGTHRPEQRDVVAFALGVVLYVFFHELGHASIDMLSLPVLGKEEDAADQISVFLLLRDNVPEIAVKGALWFNKGARIFFSRNDTHSWGPQRQVNVACWAYGGNQRKYPTVIALAKVSAERSRSCRREFIELGTSVGKLMGTHLKL